MLSKINKISIVIILVAHVGWSQVHNNNFSIIWGESIKDNQYEQYRSILEYSDEGFYAVKSNEYNTFSLERFNNKLNRIASYDYKKYIKSKNIKLPKILELGEKLILFGSIRDVKSNSSTLIAQKIDKSTLAPKGSHTEIFSTEYRNPKGAVSRAYLKRSVFNFRNSLDSTHILVLNRVNSKNKEIKRFNLLVLNEELEIVWKKKIVLPYSEKDFKIIDYKLDNEQNVYLLGKLKKTKHRNDFLILKYQKNEDVKEYKIESSKGVIKDLIIKITKENNVICSGFWGEYDKDDFKGVYFMKIKRNTGEVLYESYKDFGVDFFKMNLSEKEKEKLDKKSDKSNLKKYALREIVLREDGGAVVIAENSYSNEYTSSGSSTMPSTTNITYVRNNLIVINISPKGDIEWIRKIRKRQSSSNIYIVGYSSFIVDDKLIFLYNDHPKNLILSDLETPKSINAKKDKTILAMEILTISGKTSKYAVFSQTETGLITVPKLSIQVSDTEILVFGQSAKKRKYAKITCHNK